MRPLKILLPVLLLCLSFASSCKSSGDSPAPEEEGFAWREVTEPRWRLVEMGGRQISAASSMVLGFDSTDRISGHSGINQFLGGYTRDDQNGVKLTVLSSTQMGGTPEALELEQEFLASLPKVTSLHMIDGYLVLREGEESTLRFESFF